MSAALTKLAAIALSVAGIAYVVSQAAEALATVASALV